MFQKLSNVIRAAPDIQDVCPKANIYFKQNPMELHSKPPLAASEERLIELIQKQRGWLSFEHFMAAALYHPDFGYYAARIRDVGRKGDFTTSAQPESILARAIARWALHQKPLLRGPHRWHLIELGGGNGTMASEIFRSLGWRGRLGCTYHLVEISRPLRDLQKRKLHGHRVCWHDSLGAALDDAKGIALIFSNEVVDAYPCRRLLQENGFWFELGLTLENGRIEETTRELTKSECQEMPSSVFAIDPQTKSQTVEVHSAYRDDLLAAASRLERGSVLTIDYGDHFPALYHRQPNGTARGYFHHIRVEGMDLYTRMGQQDLTADVNFTDLENWGLEAGWTNETLIPQRDFILRWLGNITPKTTDEARLLDPIGAGLAFKVLQQNCGLTQAMNGSFPALL